MHRPSVRRTRAAAPGFAPSRLLAAALLLAWAPPAVVTPGVTTTEDVEWWLRERIREMG